MAALATVAVLALVGGFVTDWSVIVKPALKMVPRVEVLKDGEDHPGVCSSVVINKAAGFALTAGHCIPTGEPDSYAMTVNGRHAVLARVNRILDLAVVRFSVKDEEEMMLAPATPPMGSDVAVIGYGFGIGKIAVQFGRVSQGTLNDETKTLWLNVEILPGNSGGAVIDEQGRLVGISSRVYYTTASSMGAAIPVEALDDFVQPYLPAKKKP